MERIVGSWSPFIPMTVKICYPYVFVFQRLCNGVVVISTALLTLSTNFHKLGFFSSLISLYGSLSTPYKKSHIKHPFLLRLNCLSLSLHPALFSSACHIFYAYLGRVANSVGTAQNPVTAVLSYYLWQSSHCHADQ